MMMMMMINLKLLFYTFFDRYVWGAQILCYYDNSLDKEQQVS